MYVSEGLKSKALTALSVGERKAAGTLSFGSCSKFKMVQPLPKTVWQFLRKLKWLLTI